MSKSSAREDNAIFEILASSVPLTDKLSARMGKNNFTNFVTFIKNWKRMIITHFTDVANFNGVYIDIMLEIVIAKIEEFHQVAVANFGADVEGDAELITHLSTSLAGIIMSKVQSQMEIVPVKYDKISSTSALEPLTKALEIFLSGKAWKPDPKIVGGFIFVSTVIYTIDIMAFADLYYVKTLFFHSEQMSKSFESNPDYWIPFHAQFLGVKDISKLVPFNFHKDTSDTSSDTTLSDITFEVIKNSSIHLLAGEIISSVQAIKPNTNKESIRRYLSRLVAKGLVGRTNFKSNNKFYYIPPSIKKPLRDESN